MGFFEGYKRGTAVALARSDPRRRPLPPAPAPRSPKEPGGSHLAYSLANPPPIKLGFFCDDGPLAEEIECHTERHYIIFGVNGVGKSTRFLIPLMMTAMFRSMFIIDVKGEFRVQTGDERRRYSKVRTVNPYGLHGIPSDGHNPLARIKPDDPRLFKICRALSDAIIEIVTHGDKHWTASAQGLFTALIMFEVTEAAREGRKPSLINVRRMLCEGDEFEMSLNSRGEMERGPLIKGLSLTARRMVESGNQTIKNLAGRFVREHGLNEIASIQSTAQTETEWMEEGGIIADLEKDGVDFAELRQGPAPVTFYLMLDPSEVSLSRGYTRLLLTSALMAHLVPGPVSTLFVIDEMRAAVSNLRIMTEMWSLVRFAGIQFVVILQSLVQLKSMFKEEHENYIGQAGLVATLGPPGDLETAKYLSERSGKTTVPQLTFSENESTTDGGSIGSGSGVSAGGGNQNQNSGVNFGSSTSGNLSVNQVERSAFLPQELMDMPAGNGRIWLPGLGSESIPFFAPHYFRRRAPWAARVKPNPYRTA